MNIKAIELINATNEIRENLNGIKSVPLLIKIIVTLKGLDDILDPIKKSIDVVNNKYNNEKNTVVKEGGEVYKPEIVRLLNKDLTALYVTELKLPESKNKLTTDEIELLPSAMYKALYTLYNYLT